MELLHHRLCFYFESQQHLYSVFAVASYFALSLTEFAGETQFNVPFVYKVLAFSLSCLLRYVDMAVVLLQVLERTELNKLPKGIQNKLEKFVTELQNANEALKTQHERLKADSGVSLHTNLRCLTDCSDNRFLKFELKSK